MKITKETAKKIYETAPSFFKEQLESEFGKNTFKKLKFTDIKTYDDACEALEVDSRVCGVNDTEDEIAYKQLKVITRAINQGWKPDWNNTYQKKWYPYFNLRSGFGFSGSGYDFGCADAHVSSRLCFESQEKANYAGNQFLELYKQFLT